MSDSKDTTPFRMLTCFNLASGTTIEAFASALDAFSLRMQQMGLALGCEPLGQRQRHPIMDTDEERDHEYFFIMTFADRDQCDAAVQYMMSKPGKEDVDHAALIQSVSDPVFICWQDLGPA